jgi:hypothetical protein
MKKHRIDKIQEMSGASVELCPPDTDEEFAVFIDELVAIGEKAQKTGITYPEQTLKEILEDFKKPKTTIVQTFDGRRISICDGVITDIGVTEILSDDSEGIPKNFTKHIEGIPKNFTAFNSSELAILEKIKNAE